MLEHLYAALRQVEEAIEYAEACGHTYTRYYIGLCKNRRALLKAIKIFEQTERKQYK